MLWRRNGVRGWFLYTDVSQYSSASLSPCSAEPFPAQPSKALELLRAKRPLLRKVRGSYEFSQAAHPSIADSGDLRCLSGGSLRYEALDRNGQQWHNLHRFRQFWRIGGIERVRRQW